MDLSFMQNELVLALCWTLIHSLWQGLLLAMITGAVMITTRRSGANKRYRLLTILFFAFVAVAAITFVREYTTISQRNAAVQTTPSGFSGTVPVIGIGATQGENPTTPLIDRFKAYFNTHASLIVLIWFVIFIARLIHLVANLVYVNRLKHYKTAMPGEEWLRRLASLVETLHIRKRIGMLESGIVRVPVVMGVLKPVILLPAGLLSHLPADEIEAILLHELAHIKRRDYLVNLLQNFAETIFFFNPALMWVSSMIREERENCCDDIAISVTNSKSNFINALIAFQEYNIAASRYAVGFTGRKNQLLNRVQRIVHEKNKTLNAAEKSLLTLGMGIFILFSIASAKKISPSLLKELAPKRSAVVEDHTPVEQAADTIAEHQTGDALAELTATDTSTYYEAMLNESVDPLSISDTIPKHKRAPEKWKGSDLFHLEGNDEKGSASDSISNRFTGMTVNSHPENNKDVLISATAKTGTEYKVHKIDGVVKEFFVDGNPVSDLSAYATVIADIDRAIEYRQRMVLRKWSALRQENEKRLVIKEDRRGDEQRIKLDAREFDTKKFQFELDSKRKAPSNPGQDSLKNREWDKKRQQTDIKRDFKKISDRERAELDGKKGNATRFDKKQLTARESELSYLSALKSKEGSVLKDSLARLHNGRERIAYLDKLEGLRTQLAEDKTLMERQGRQIRAIAADLEKEGIKIDLATGWFALDKNQFVVNGKAMTKELHEKFIARYVTSHEGWGYYYGPVQVTGRGIFMDYGSLSK